MKHPRLVLAALVVLGTLGGAAARAAQGPQERGAAPRDQVERGRQLYVTGCSSCHGLEGAGSEQGPALTESGAAGAYYYLATGRMPLANPGDNGRRKPPAYDAEEIRALVAYVASLGDGPPLPEVDPAAGDLSEGGALFRSNCAPCHSAAGIGGALSYGRAAPSLSPSDPLVVATAMRIGPGQMPVFSEAIADDDQLDAIVRYVQFLQDPPTPGGATLGGAGPVPEGFVAWVFGIGPLLLLTLWIGTRGGRSRS